MGENSLILITSTTHAKACEQKPALIISMAHERNCILKYLNLVKVHFYSLLAILFLEFPCENKEMLSNLRAQIDTEQ